MILFNCFKILTAVLTALALSTLSSCASFDGLANKIEKNPVIAEVIIQEAIIAAIKKSPAQDREALALKIQTEANKAIDFFDGELITINLIDEYIEREYDYTTMRPSEIAIVQLVAGKVKQGLISATNNTNSGLSADSLFTTKFVLENVVVGANSYAQAN